MGQRPRSPLEEHVRRRIRELRVAHGLTQEELCERARISSDAVTRIERGSRVPTLETLERLARAFGVSPVAFMEDPPAQTQQRASTLARIEGLLEAAPPDVQELALALVTTVVRTAQRRRRRKRA